MVILFRLEPQETQPCTHEIESPAFIEREQSQALTHINDMTIVVSPRNYQIANQGRLDEMICQERF
jgi:hypothetical protein